MENQHDNDSFGANEHSATNNKRKILYTLLVILLVSSIGVIAYLFYQNEQLEEVSQQQQLEIRTMYLQLDSVSEELSLRIQEIQKLGGNIDSLELMKNKLEIEKRKLLTSANVQRSKIKELSEQLTGYKQVLVWKDEEIAHLKELNEALNVENTDLKIEKNQLNDTIRQLEGTNTALQEKVEIASRLEIDQMKIIAINKRGKERATKIYRNKNVEKIKIQFNIRSNEVAPIGARNILLRIVDTNGKALFDTNKGSGSFTLNNRDLFFTSQQEIVYDRKQKSVIFTFDKGSDYEIGKYVVEIYTDGYLMGKDVFIIN